MSLSDIVTALTSFAKSQKRMLETTYELRRQNEAATQKQNQIMGYVVKLDKHQQKMIVQLNGGAKYGNDLNEETNKVVDLQANIQEQMKEVATTQTQIVNDFSTLKRGLVKLNKNAVAEIQTSKVHMTNLKRNQTELETTMSNFKDVVTEETGEFKVALDRLSKGIMDEMPERLKKEVANKPA